VAYVRSQVTHVSPFKESPVFVRSALIALAVTLAAPVAAFAQSAPAAPPAAPPAAAAPQTPHHHHARYLAAIRSLGLTPDQQQQIHGFMRERKAANAGADAATRRVNAKKFRHEVLGVLTPDQRAQLHAAMVQQRTTPAQQ
jgi:Spy/CpxP family protein refolding chaperone